MISAYMPEKFAYLDLHSTMGLSRNRILMSAKRLDALTTCC
jgi:hypothetical protein